ncbi:hypothetical protein A5881_003603 [Enterococcus termitis]|nr:hypothetical protein A5881_003849 [Enterococcus termitis]
MLNIYAGHTKNAVNGLDYSVEKKINCIMYKGNKENWQKIYEKSESNIINKDLELFLETNKEEIAIEIQKIIGFKCKFRDGVSGLYLRLVNSFIDNKGLFLKPNYLVPEYIPRLIITRASPVTLWGYIPLDAVKELIEQVPELAPAIDEDGKFKPKGHVQFVGVLDNDRNSSEIKIKLLFDNKELVIKRIKSRIE